MRDETNQNDKLFSEQSAERNSPDNRFQKLQGADVDRASTEPEEITAGREAMREFSPGHATNADKPATQSQRASRVDMSQAAEQGEGKENNLPETVSLNTEPIDRPTKLS